LVQSISSLDRAARLIPDAPSAHAALDGPDAPDYTYGLSKIRVPELRAKDPARDGRGIRVGIIDTGIDPNHPALVGKAILFKNFVGGQGPAPTSRQDSPQDSSPSAAASAAFDDQGHGTHVAGTIAGSNSPDQAFGVAPGAQLIIGKAFGASGEFSVKGLLASMQWMADPDGDPATDDAPHLVSNSWTADIDPKNESPSDDPLCAAVDTWVKLGIIPVFAIGNDGPKGESIGIPAACPGTVAVGASDDRDEVPQFSSRGPARWKSSVAQKPDIVAPGQDIVSAAAGGGTTAKSGTSMAAPHVAGALALLLQGLARQDDARVEQALIQGADKLGQPAWNADSGNGRIDLVRSLELLGNK
jgi:subtilisin family serine protease